MLRFLRACLSPVAELPAWQFWLRSLWIIVMIVAAYCMANQVSPFFYQRF
jgi:hypothetical protein